MLFVIAIVILVLIIAYIEAEKKQKQKESIELDKKQRKDKTDKILDICEKLKSNVDYNFLLNEFKKTITGKENEINHISFSSDQKYIVVCFKRQKSVDFQPPVFIADIKIPLYSLWFEEDDERVALFYLLLQNNPFLEYHYFSEYSGIKKTRNLEEVYFESCESAGADALVLWNSR